MHLVSKTETFAKLFFSLSFLGILMYIILAFYSLRTTFNTISKSEQREVQEIEIIPKRFSNDLKYILLWTIPELRYNLTIVGQKLFIDSNCPFKNCYLTTNKSLLNDVSNFNSIVFSINTLKNWAVNMPRKRSPKQKYVFYSMIAAEKFPICNIKADGYFNWTWSYKLYSDIVTPFIEVRDENGKAVAPKHGTAWNDSESIESETLEDDGNQNPVKVGNKTKALMWYMTKCDVDRKMVSYIRQLKAAMKEHFLDFDIFGCGFKKCPNGECLKALERDYYFYLALEEVFSQDYVTTEVLKGFRHNAVPVVVGGADYMKFLPFNSYIDASHEEVEQLAATLHYTIKSPATYESYFSWKQHFTINEVRIERGYCDLCALLNNNKVEKKSVYDSFRSWWYDGPLKERCVPKGAEKFEDVLSYIKNNK